MEAGLNMMLRAISSKISGRVFELDGELGLRKVVGGKIGVYLELQWILTCQSPPVGLCRRGDQPSTHHHPRNPQDNGDSEDNLGKGTIL
jgi:hypothetical protein